MTHGVSHLSQCDDIIVVSQCRIVDRGPYKDLIIKSKILKDFVRSVGNAGKEQFQRQASGLGKYDSKHLALRFSETHRCIMFRMAEECIHYSIGADSQSIRND